MKLPSFLYAVDKYTYRLPLSGQAIADDLHLCLQR